MGLNIFRGTFPALVTPMVNSDDTVKHPINEAVMGELVKYVLDGGCEGVVVAGCTGHAASFTIDEQVGLIKLVKELVDDYNDRNSTGKVVIAGDGSNSTHESIEFAQRVERDANVLHHLMISPYSNKPSQRGLVQHYSSIANNVNGVIIMYSVPGRTGGQGILPETVEELAHLEKIIGIKEASGDIKRIEDTIRRTATLDFVVGSGDDALNIDIARLNYEITRKYKGAAISVAANVDPNRTSQSMRYALDGNFAKAQQIDDQLKPLYQALFLPDDGNPVMAHYALRRMGYNVGVPRLPLVDASIANKQVMDMALEGLVLIKSKIVAK